MVDPTMMGYPAPELIQASDIDILVQLGAIVAPGLIRRDEREPPSDRLWIWVEGGDAHTDALYDLAYGAFQILLGLLRAWRTPAGELRAEADQRRAYGGAARNDRGDQWVLGLGALGHSVVGGEVERFATSARDAIEVSANLTDALWLNGRLGRTAADYLMMREYAGREFGKASAISAALSVTEAELELLAESANNLAPRLGGRHVGQRRAAPWSLDQQREFTARMLRSWAERGRKARD
jgi:hypothetical protein